MVGCSKEQSCEDQILQDLENHVLVLRKYNSDYTNVHNFREQTVKPVLPKVVPPSAGILPSLPHSIHISLSYIYS